MRPGTGRRPIDAATIYAHRGWAVFPCHSPAAALGRCTCGLAECSSPAKHPRLAGGLKVATTDRGQIKAWWSRWPNANVAIRTGEVSAIVVVDIDPAHGGETSLARLVEERGELPAGRVVRTGSGGRHLYFRHPGEPVRNDTGRRLGPGLDIRGDGGYVIAPPSRHASGGRYAVAGHGGVVPALPEWLDELLRPPPPARAAQTSPWRPGRDNTPWARAALEGELAVLQAAQPGMRNHTLNRVAFRLGQIIAGGGLDEGEVEGALMNGALALGLGDREATATVHSGLSAGEECPRGPADAATRTRREDVASVDGP